MVEISRERIKEILHEETVQKEALDTILRAVYARYMRLFEKYFADTDALNNNMIAELRKDHQETLSLIKYYYMDIPLDICAALREFEDKYKAPLLGPEWRKYLSDCMEEFRKASGDSCSGGKDLKAAFAKQALTNFYDAMGYVFREGFGTGSQTTDNIICGIRGLLFGKEK